MDDALRGAELVRVRLPLVAPFRAAHSTTAVKDALLVRVETDAGVGWGECSAPATPAYDGETLDSARLALRDHLLPRAFAGAPLTDVRGSASARAALECALLDARLRAEGISLAAWIGATRATVDAGVAVGILDGPAELRRTLDAYVSAGYTRVKCKIEPGNDVETVAAARDQIGRRVALAADANGGYGVDDARCLLDAVADLELQCVEQPCAPDALADHTALRATAVTRVCLDESITSARIAEEAIAMRACDIVSIKPARLGISGARAVHDVCVRAGVDALAGGMLETGIGRAVLLAVAALPGCTLTGDCSASDRFFGAGGDITEPFELEGGTLRVPNGPGLGVEPIRDRLARCTVASERVSARD